MSRLRIVTGLLLACGLAAASVPAHAAAASGLAAAAHGPVRGVAAGHTAAEPAGLVHRFDAVISEIEQLPYQPAYAPTGLDSAFAPADVPNDFPAEDYTSGSVPGSPDAPAWPADFQPVLLHSLDGTPLTGELALHPGQHPGVLVVHGFNTHGNLSVIRWAAMLAANGFDVLAADQRDYSAEYSGGYGYPNNLQTFGWKESQDVLAAGEYLRQQPGVTSVGVVGFSEGGQNTVLALAQDTHHVFSAGLTFSGPADQNTQIYSTRQPDTCSPPDCDYPVTDALVALVVPPYTNASVCSVLGEAATYYHTTGQAILNREEAFRAQLRVHVPLLNFYAADDPLVPSYEATMTAGYEGGNPLQQTLELTRGGHAYYLDRWWQQEAILDYFAALLPGASTGGQATVSTQATVNQTPGGQPLAGQLASLGQPTRAQADSYLAPYVC